LHFTRLRAAPALGLWYRGLAQRPQEPADRMITLQNKQGCARQLPETRLEGGRPSAEGEDSHHIVRTETSVATVGTIRARLIAISAHLAPAAIEPLKRGLFDPNNGVGIGQKKIH